MPQPARYEMKYPEILDRVKRMGPELCRQMLRSGTCPCCGDMDMDLHGIFLHHYNCNLNSVRDFIDAPKINADIEQLLDKIDRDGHLSCPTGTPTD